MMKASTMISVCALMSFAAVLHTNGEHDWAVWNGHRYAITTNCGSWTAAESEAESVGGQLATIDNAAENTWLATFITNCFPVGHEGDPPWNAAWIGYRQDAGQWGWVNGTPVTYTNRSQYWGSSVGTMAYLHGALHPDAFTWNHVAPIDLKGVIEIPSLMKILGITVATETISFSVTNVVPNQVVTLEQCESLILSNWSYTNSTTPTAFTATLSITNRGKEALYFRTRQ